MLKDALVTATATLATALSPAGARATAPPQQGPAQVAAAPPKAPWMLEALPDGTNRIRASLHPGQAAAMRSEALTTLVLSGTQSGKALDLNTPIPTPDGWRTMGELEAGDLVFDANGQPTRIVLVSPIYVGHDCYRVTFDDRTSLVADGEHQWTTQTYRERKSVGRRTPEANLQRARSLTRLNLVPQRGVRTTAEIAMTLVDWRGAVNHSIDIGPGPQLPDRTFLIPPYTLGAWLGDGTSSGADITTEDAEVLANIRADGIAVGEAREVNAGNARGYHLGSTGPRLRNLRGQWSGDGSTLIERLTTLGVRENKHIPETYLFASRPQRLALLQGLMDTDGSVHASGKGASCEFSNTNPRLVSDVTMLIRSLGIKVRVTTRIPRLHGRPMRLAYRLTFTTSEPVFRITRKLERLKPISRSDTRRRFVVACDPVASVPVKCIAVESPTASYLCSDAYVTTHNTSLGPLWLEREIRRRGPGDYMAITSTYPLLSRKMLPEFLKLFEHTLHLGTWSKGDKMFSFHDGETRVMFGSATNPESLESATAKGAWLDEAGQSQFRLESWEAIQRRLGLNQGRTFISTTPYNRAWLKTQVYDRAVAGDPDYRVIQFPSIMNPAFPREEAARVERTLPGWKYRMFYLGLFDKPPGMIYQDFSDTYREQGGHLVKWFPIPHWWPRFIGLDFGGVNLAKIYLAMDPLTRVFYAYHEVLGGGLTSERHVQNTAADLAGAMLGGVWGGTKNEGAWRLEWSNAGVLVMPPPVWDVEIGIDSVIGMFKDRKLMVFDNLKGLRDELGIYSRPVDAQGNVLSGILDKSHFHRLDALRSVALGVKDMAGPQPVLAFGSARGWQPRI